MVKRKKTRKKIERITSFRLNYGKERILGVNVPYTKKQKKDMDKIDREAFESLEKLEAPELDRFFYQMNEISERHPKEPLVKRLAHVYFDPKNYSKTRKCKACGKPMPIGNHGKFCTDCELLRITLIHEAKLERKGLF